MTDTLSRIASALADRYTIERELGRGGMAVVYLARDLKHERQVAVKVLRPELAAAVGAERFQQEIKIAANLNHPHVLPLLDSGESDGFLFFVMPYIGGESLRDKLANEGELPINDAVRILREVVDALAHAHEQGVVHRDIKPDNVMLSGRHALVTDFGVAKAVSEATGRQKLTTEGIALGTPAYMAPEQAAADPHIDHRADIYAVGVIAYELLTGRTPFVGNTQQELLAAHVTQTPDLVTKYRESVPPALAALVMKCLQKRAADRWQTADELLPQLEALATPSGGVTPTGTTPVESVRKIRWKMVAGAAVAIVAAVAAAISYVVLTDSAPEHPPMIVVVPLENRSADTESAVWGEYAADWITREIDRAEFIRVVPSTTVRDMLRFLGGEKVVPVVTLAERMGATVAIAGGYLSSGGNIRFEVEIVDAETGELLHVLDPVAGLVDSAEVVIATLAARTVGAAMTLLDSDAPAWASIATKPPSREVFREFATGSELFCEGEYDDALVHLERALELDSTFAPALIVAATAHYNSGRRRQDDSLLSLLLPLRDRLSRYERLSLDWKRAWADGDLEAERRVAEELFRLTPQLAAPMAGRTAIRTNRPAEALIRWAANDWDAPCTRAFVGDWAYYAVAYHMLEDFNGELKVARNARRHNPASFRILDAQIRSLAAQGKVEEVDSLVAIAFTIPPNPSNPYGLRLVQAALEYRAHGYGDAYENAIGRAVAWFQNRPQEEGSPYNLALSLYYAERFEEAYPIFDSLVATNPEDVTQIGLLGATSAYLGRREEAIELEQRLENMQLPYLEGAHTFWRAKIAAVLGEAERAVQLLHRGLQEGLEFGLWLHRGPEFESLRDDPPFQELMRPKG